MGSGDPDNYKQSVTFVYFRLNYFSVLSFANWLLSLFDPTLLSLIDFGAVLCLIAWFINTTTITDHKRNKKANWNEKRVFMFKK